MYMKSIPVSLTVPLGFPVTVAMELVITNRFTPAFSAWRKTFREPSIAVYPRRQQEFERVSDQQPTHIQHLFRFHSAWKGRGCVNDSVHTSQRLGKLLMYDV